MCSSAIDFFNRLLRDAAHYFLHNVRSVEIGSFYGALAAD